MGDGRRLSSDEQIILIERRLVQPVPYWRDRGGLHLRGASVRIVDIEDGRKVEGHAPQDRAEDHADAKGG